MKEALDGEGNRREMRLDQPSKKTAKDDDDEDVKDWEMTQNNTLSDPAGLNSKLISLRMFPSTGHESFLLEVESFSRYLKP